MKLENPDYLQNQLITYIGNKRALLDFIGEAVAIVQKDLGKEKLHCLDMFSGSGIVARYLKQFSASITVNDLEQYSCIINRCYLSNLDSSQKKILEQLFNQLNEKINTKMEELSAQRKDNPSKKICPGFISEYYSPADTENILPNERCFYTTYNANYLDIARQLIETEIPDEYKDFFIAPLLSEASVHANTSGVFKGFYKNSASGLGQFGGNGKNALSRIMGNISIQLPVLSEFECPFRVFNEEANLLSQNDALYEIPGSSEKLFDLAYFDPPYNQHPYGSNYFMLNLLADYSRPDEEKMSRVSGIPKNWNRSVYNKKKQVADVFFELIKNIRAKYVLISFNSEGFISKDQMLELLSQCGTVQVLESKYNTFRGSRNLGNRSIYVKEYLFLIKIH